MSNNIKSNNKIYLIIILLVVIIILLSAIIFLFFGKNESDITTTVKNEYELTLRKEEVTSEKITNTSVDNQSDTSENTFDPGKLYRPDESMFCNQYRRYISGNFEGQGYAKMRFGPSKSKYNVVGQIDNGNIVTVETLSVDGWTLVYYEGKEGWVRTDFLFETYEDCFDKQPVYPDIELCGYSALVDVTGEYDGEPLNMRSGLSREYSLLTTVPDGAWVEVHGELSTDSSWTYVEYNGYRGWVLTKYLIIDIVGDKPVLYLYPEKKTDISVKINFSEDMRFACTYPEYNNGWFITAFPDGTIRDKATNKTYSYLYWELTGKQNYDLSKGFVVKGKDTAEFLESTLSYLGLNSKEINDFIVYWLPRMQNNEYNLISFQNEAYTDNVQLYVSPEPDSVLRVFMTYKALDSFVDVEPQKLSTFNRTGFSLVEWGGTEIKD